LGLDLADHSLVERGLHHFGLSSSPDFQVPDAGAPQRRGTLVSRYMKTSLGWTVSVPPKGQAPVGIIYCLHGKGGTNRMAFDDVHVPDVAAYVGLPVAVAAVDGGSDSYWHRRADGTDAMAMLMEEFVPLVTSMVGDHPQALMGWSMGGYGALLAAERYRPAFVAVAPASPAIWLTPGATAPGAFDSPADFYANNVLTDLDPLRGMAVAVACGTGDPFYDSTRHLVSLMDFPHRAFYGPGFHDPAYWRSVAPAQLRAVRGAFG
jgi:enterochelin esterase-like enzyme